MITACVQDEHASDFYNLISFLNSLKELKLLKFLKKAVVNPHPLLHTHYQVWIHGWCTGVVADCQNLLLLIK